jgi:hypothetical protein
MLTVIYVHIFPGGNITKHTFYDVLTAHSPIPTSEPFLYISLQLQQQQQKVAVLVLLTMI